MYVKIEVFDKDVDNDYCHSCDPSPPQEEQKEGESGAWCSKNKKQKNSKKMKKKAHHQHTESSLWANRNGSMGGLSSRIEMEADPEKDRGIKGVQSVNAQVIVRFEICKDDLIHNYK